MRQSDIGMIGLAVMGSNLARNMEKKGYTVSVYNLESEMTERFLQEEEGRNFVGAGTLEELTAQLKKPRIVMMMIRAGKPVDEVIDQLLPLLEEGDIIIDGGNSHFPDTMRRTKKVEAAGKYFIGCGVSGGEEGALHGPSLMPGGSIKAWPYVKPVLTDISAKTEDGTPCCDWVGENGAGHFVKMVHNGIEYGDMQLICEAYHMMRDYIGLSTVQMQRIFNDWNKTELDSYLIGITADILGKMGEDGTPLVDQILDAAGQKGTGKWTGIAALEEGVPLTLISEAVFARNLSAMKKERRAASELYRKKIPAFTGNPEELTECIRQALYASKIISYTQGYLLMHAAAGHYGWNLNYGGIALMWRGGCIIRSRFLGKIREAYEKNPELTNLLSDSYFKKAVEAAIPGWRKAVAAAVMAGIPVPAMSAALTWFDGWTTERLPANLLQAQRDYFGAHTYQRADDPEGPPVHTKWY